MAAADTYPRLVRDSSVELPAVRMRQLFETASALRRRHVYAEAKRSGIERLVWPGLVSASLASSIDDQQLLASGCGFTHPSPADEKAVPFYYKVR